MSQSSDDEVNRREVAYRLFAAEFEDADFSYAESDEERAPNYVVTPTGARVNRVFVVGVLTEVEQVSDDVVRARIVDPTGAFVVYAGQYQPEALASLEAADAPSFVAVTGKARTFQPDDADVVYTSIRPEHVSEVDAETRDRWTVATAEQTVERLATVAAARDRVERGDDLQRVLEAADVAPGLAAGVPIALDHYDTSPAYLRAVYDLSLDAARVVAGEREEVEGLSLSPGEGGDADLPFAETLAVDVEVGSGDEATAASGGESEATAETEDGSEAESADDAETASSASTETEAASVETPATDETAAEAATDEGSGESGADHSIDEADADSAAEADAEPTTDAADEGEATEEADAGSAPASDASEEPSAGADQPADEGDGEMYDLSEEEREEIKENHDVDFSSGSEIPDAGEADIDAPEPDESAADADETGEPAGAGDADPDLGTEATSSDVESDDLDDFEADEDLPDADGDVEEVDSLDDFTEEEYDDAASDAEDAGVSAMDRTLEDAVVDIMEEFDDGDGARREEVVAEAADRFDADEGEIEDAIEDALMGGRCYESGDDHLKAI